MNNFRKVLICGTMVDEYIDAAKKLETEGHIILMSHVATGFLSIDKFKAMLEICDGIYMINKSGHLDEDSKAKIDLAKATGKWIKYRYGHTAI